MKYAAGENPVREFALGEKRVKPFSRRRVSYSLILTDKRIIACTEAFNGVKREAILLSNIRTVECGRDPIRLKYVVRFLALLVGTVGFMLSLFLLSAQIPLFAVGFSLIMYATIALGIDPYYFGTVIRIAGINPSFNRSIGEVVYTDEIRLPTDGEIARIVVRDIRSYLDSPSSGEEVVTEGKSSE